MIQTDNFQKVEVASSEELRSWLGKHPKRQENFEIDDFRKKRNEWCLGSI